MTISPVTVFEGTLPSMTDPVTFDPRMAALMEFIVDVFGPEFAASIAQINAAFAGADDVTTALAALTVSRGYGAAAAPLRGRNDAATISNDGFAYANAGTAGNPTSDEAYLFLRHKGAGDTVGAILAIGQTSRNFYIAVRNAGAWGDWLQMPRIGTTAGTVPALNAGGFLPAGIAINWSVPQTVSGQSAVDFGPIPSTATMIFVECWQATLSATDSFLVQLGTSGGFVSAGYASNSMVFVSGSNGSVPSTAGFSIASGAVARTFSGRMTLTKIAGTNRWISNHLGSGGAAFMTSGGGTVDLGGVATQLRFTRASTATIAGTFMVGWL